MLLFDYIFIACALGNGIIGCSTLKLLHSIGPAEDRAAPLREVGTVRSGLSRQQRYPAAR